MAVSASDGGAGRRPHYGQCASVAAIQCCSVCGVRCSDGCGDWSPPETRLSLVFRPSRVDRLRALPPTTAGRGSPERGEVGTPTGHGRCRTVRRSVLRCRVRLLAPWLSVARSPGWRLVESLTGLSVGAPGPGAPRSPALGKPRRRRVGHRDASRCLLHQRRGALENVQSSAACGIIGANLPRRRRQGIAQETSKE